MASRSNQGLAQYLPFPLKVRLGQATPKPATTPVADFPPVKWDMEAPAAARPARECVRQDHSTERLRPFQEERRPRLHQLVISDTSAF